MKWIRCDSWHLDRKLFKNLLPISHNTLHKYKLRRSVKGDLCNPGHCRHFKNWRKHLSLFISKSQRFWSSLFTGQKNLVFVTDRGATIVAALRGFRRLNCSAHILDVVLSHAFSTAVMYKAPEVGQLLKDVQKLFTYFKHSGLQVKLSKSLKQSGETRWNFEMLDSVPQLYDDIATILLDNKQYDKVVCIIKNTLKTLVTFLKLFKDATDDLESDCKTKKPLQGSQGWLRSHWNCISLCTMSGRTNVAEQFGSKWNSHALQNSNVPHSQTASVKDGLWLWKDNLWFMPSKCYLMSCGLTR